MDNLTSALTFTFDDATPNQALIAAPELSKRGMLGTFFLSVVDVSDWSRWQSVSDKFHELGSHSVNHVDLTAQTLSVMEYEIVDSKLDIEQNVTGASVQTFCYPFGAYNDTVRETVAKYYASARAVWHIDYNPPTLEDIFIVRPAYFFENISAQTMNGYINDSIANNGWVVEMLHGIGDISDGYEPVPVANLTAHLDFVETKRDAGDVWVDTYENVTKYIAERLNTSIDYQVDATGGNITVNLSTPLNTTVYDQPITFRTRVPDTWTEVFIRYENGTYIKKVPVFEGGKKYVFYNEVPLNQSLRLSGAMVPGFMHFTEEPGYSNSFYQPTNGDSQTDFTFKVNVTSVDEIKLVQPKEYLEVPNAVEFTEEAPYITIDVNGDGDILDNVSGFKEGPYPMEQSNVSDSVLADGKIFWYTAKFPPGSNPKVRFDAKDVLDRNISYPKIESGYVIGPEINNKPEAPYSIIILDDHSLKPRLNWQCEPDSDGDSIEFNITLGKAPNATDIMDNVTTSSKSIDIPVQLQFNTPYYGHILTEDLRGMASEKIYFEFTQTNVRPWEASNLRVESNRTLTPEILWDPAGDPDGDNITYVITGYLVDDDSVIFSDSNLTDSKFNITNPLEDNVTVRVEVIAVDEFDESSNTLSEIFHFNIPPPRIDALSTVPGNGTLRAIDIEWEILGPALADWSSFKIYRSTSQFTSLSEGADLVAELTSSYSLRKYIDTNLEVNTTYYYTVIPVDTSGDFFDSDLVINSSKPGVEVLPPPPPPPPPPTPELPPPPIEGIEAEDLPNATNSILVTWEPTNASNAVGYHLYRSTHMFSLLIESIMQANLTADLNDTEYVDSDVENNITYFYAVAAFSGSGLENRADFELAFAISLDDREITVPDDKLDDNDTKPDDKPEDPDNGTGGEEPPDGPGDNITDDPGDDGEPKDTSEPDDEEDSTLGKELQVLAIGIIIIIIASLAVMFVGRRSAASGTTVTRPVKRIKRKAARKAEEEGSEEEELSEADEEE
jgi:hypothetical protein